MIGVPNALGRTSRQDHAVNLWVAWARAVGLWLVPQALMLVALLLSRNAWAEYDTWAVARFWIGLVYPFSAVGALILAREPRQQVGWVVWAIAATLAADLWGEQWSSFDAGALPAAGPIGQVSETFWMASVVVSLTLLPLVFPTGHPLSRRWSWFGWSAALGMIALIGGLAVEASGPLELTIAVGFFLVCVGVAGSLVSMAMRFRRSRGVERQQLKWFVVGVAIPAGLVILDLVGDVSGLGSFTALPIAVAIGVAMLRYRLFEIDRLINRALVYLCLTATLALAYFAIVLVIDSITAAVVDRDSSLAIAASTLAVAAMFRPLRGRVQQFVDRRFYRQKYNAERVVDQFGERLRDETSLTTLGAALQATVRETMQPTTVSLWLRPGDWGQIGKTSDS
jgi:hypothetical protein